MNRKLHLLNRRRNNVLVARHVRAVSLRHVPHQYVYVNVKKEVQDVEKIETSVVEEKNKTVEEVNKAEVIKPVKKQPTAEEKISTAIEHMKLAVAEHGEYVAVREMRKHIGWYIKGLKNSARYRDEINKLTDCESVIMKLKELSLTQSE